MNIRDKMTILALVKSLQNISHVVILISIIFGGQYSIAKVFLNERLIGWVEPL